MTPTLEQRLNATLDVLCGPQGDRPLDSTLRQWVEDSLVLMEFVLDVEEEFQIDLDGYESQVTFESTLAECLEVIEGLMA